MVATEPLIQLNKSPHEKLIENRTDIPRIEKVSRRYHAYYINVFVTSHKIEPIKIQETRCILDGITPMAFFCMAWYKAVVLHELFSRLKHFRNEMIFLQACYVIFVIRR